MHFLIVKNAYLHEPHPHPTPHITPHHTYNTTTKPQRLQRILIQILYPKSPADIDFCAPRLHGINKLHNTKCQCLMVPFMSYFMHDPLFLLISRYFAFWQEFLWWITRNWSEIRLSSKLRVIFIVNCRSKYQTENYGLGHFGRIGFQEIL